MTLPRDVLKEYMPLVSSVLEHPRIKASPQLTAIIETLADGDAFNALSRAEIALYLGVHLGVIKDLLEENDRMREQLAKAFTAVTGLIRPQ